MTQLHYYATRPWWYIVFTVVISLGGCAFPLSFKASVPHKVPPGVSGFIKDNIIVLNLHMVAVALQLQNFQTAPGSAFHSLSVWLNIYSAPGTLTVDPQQVTLTASNGPAQQAMTCLGPSEAWQSPRAIMRGCGPRRYSFGTSMSSRVDVSPYDMLHGNSNKKTIRFPEEGPVSIRGNECLMFWFDTDPSPAIPFTVSIRGVTFNGMPITIPDVHFGPGRVVKVIVIP